MKEGQERIRSVLETFTGRDGEPGTESERYILKSMWLMMLSEFEAVIKQYAETYIDSVRQLSITDIHVCLLVRNFIGEKQEELTLNKIVSLYKKNPADINYCNFTKDRVPKYKKPAVEKLLNNLGIFLTEEEQSSLSLLDSVSSTRDSIAHGDIGVEITRAELETRLEELDCLVELIEEKLTPPTSIQNNP